MSNIQNLRCPRCKQQQESRLHFIFYFKLSKTTLDFISELINLNWSFNILFKVDFKTIIMWAPSQFHDGVQLKIFPTLLEVLLRYLSYCCRKGFHDDGYDKINELVILSFTSKISEILLQNWTLKEPFWRPATTF